MIDLSTKYSIDFKKLTKLITKHYGDSCGGGGETYTWIRWDLDMLEQQLSATKCTYCKEYLHKICCCQKLETLKCSFCHKTGHSSPHCRTLIDRTGKIIKQHPAEKIRCDGKCVDIWLKRHTV